jgi:hypothetical protein
MLIESECQMIGIDIHAYCVQEHRRNSFDLGVVK